MLLYKLFFVYNKPINISTYVPKPSFAKMFNNFIKDKPYVTLFQSGREILHPKTGFYMPTLPIACQSTNIIRYINTNRLFVPVILIYCLANNTV